MKIGIPKEILPGETRVAIVPKIVAQLKRDGIEVIVETGAGGDSAFADDEYEKGGATIAADAAALYSVADIIMKVQPPRLNETAGRHEIDMMKEGATYIGFLNPTANKEVIRKMTAKKITCFAMEFIPRIARAQSMDALSSMASIAGYRAALIAAQHLGKYFPLMMTAAGSIPPARVLILGAGVAGLQAIATAKRLGARVEAFDVRPAVREQVESLGGIFVQMEMPKDTETEGGYAKELSPEFIKKELETIGSRLEKSDAVITTAQVFGKRAPTLISAEMAKKMHKGAVIVDLAAEQGGNCELTEPGKTVVKHGIIIAGPVNLPATLPFDASQLYARNVLNLFNTIYNKEMTSDFEDEVTKGTCVIQNGEIRNNIVKSALQ